MNLQRGSKGFEVVKLQQQLNRVGAMLVCDGDFGGGTERAVRYAQDMAELTTDGICNQVLQHWLDSQPEPYQELTTEGVAMIAREETGGLAYYHAVCRFPHYPGYSSGITIGVGYDLHFASESSFRELWQPYMAVGAVNELANDIGKRGTKSRAAELRNKGIEVPFKAAWPVFVEQLMPQYFSLTKSVFPQLSRLPKSCRAVLVSLVFNRGASLEGDRRKEMRAIRDKLASAFSATAGNDLAAQRQLLMSIEDDIVSMQRLWGSDSGLYRRRQVEANMWRNGLQPL